MKKITREIKPKKIKKKRTYNNTLRSEKSDQAQKEIIQIYVSLLAKNRGSEVSIEELALASKVSQRTIFRFFEDKQALHYATNQYIQQFVIASLQKIKDKDIYTFAKDTFLLYEKYENLIMAYMFSPFGMETRLIFRKKLNEILIQQILKMKKIKITRKIETRLALIVTLINAKIWFDIRSDFKHTSLEIGEAVSWALKILIDQI